MEDNIELVAKLKLDTSEAEKQLSDVADKANEAKDSAEGIKLPEGVTKGLKELFSGEKGLGNLAKIAKGAVSGVGQLGGALQAVSSSLPKLSGVVGVVVAIVSLLIKIAQGTDTWEYLSASVGAITEMLRDDLAPLIASFGEALIVGLREVKDLLDPIVRIVMSILHPLMDALLAGIKQVDPIVGIVSAVLDLVASLIDVIMGPLQGVSESLMADMTVLIEDCLKPVVDWIGKLSEALQVLKEKIQTTIEKITGGLIRFDRELESTTGKENEKFKTSLDTWEQAGAESNEEKAARFAAEAQEQQEKAAEELRKRLEELKAGFDSVFDKAKSAASSAWEAIKSTAQAFWHNTIKVASNAWSGAKEIAQKTWDNISGFAKSSWSQATSFALSAWTSFKHWWDGLWGGLKTKAGDAVGAVSGALAGIFAGIKSHASGGTILTGAQVWGMNEAGNPEFMFNAGGRDTVVNASILADAVFSGVSRAMSRTGNTQVLEVDVKAGAPMGQRELVQWLLPSLKFALAK